MRLKRFSVFPNDKIVHLKYIWIEMWNNLRCYMLFLDCKLRGTKHLPSIMDRDRSKTHLSCKSFYLPSQYTKPKIWHWLSWQSWIGARAKRLTFCMVLHTSTKGKKYIWWVHFHHLQIKTTLILHKLHLWIVRNFVFFVKVWNPIQRYL